VGIAAAADAPSYGLVFLLVVVSGLGIAAYHPEGSKFAAYASGERRASGMSAFSIGGNVGYALGPICAGLAVASLGLRGGWLLVVPCVAVAALLVRRHGYLASFAPDRDAARGAAAGEDDTRSLVLLLGVIAFRSCAWFGLLTFVPLWEVSLGHTKSYGSHLLALMLLAGGVGTIAAGPAADRFGRLRVLLVSLVATPLLIAGFIVFGGAVGAACLALVGPCVVGTFGVTAVMSQEYLPARIGMASGLAIGMSVGLGGIAAVVLGAVADAVDLRSAMWVAAAAPLVAIGLALFLPAAQRRPVRLVDPSVNVT
jgi:FSR family fosmidomycin resistance protein-like MFS transporter